MQCMASKAKMNNKAKIIIPAIAAALVVGGLSYAQKDGIGKSSQSIGSTAATQVQQQVKPEFMDFYDPTFEQLIADADLVVYGQVKKFNEKVEAVIAGPAEDAVKAKLASKGSSMKIHVTPMEIDVKQVISGNASSSIIIRRSELSEPYEPELKVGQKMVFVLKKIEGTENVYKVMHPTGTYFDAEDSKMIKPYFNKFNDLSSISLEDFSDKVKKEKGQN
ncbi:hypothetical protein [Paenibacillus gansuensis]|uniref:Copper amine oxidase-like N-terminal domain-containing protein n=1 Tax=Paenibacillus gansuensis TaxID=306542 RepID=A0ABW5PIX7_9BACL